MFPSPALPWHWCQQPAESATGVCVVLCMCEPCEAMWVCCGKVSVPWEVLLEVVIYICTTDKVAFNQLAWHVQSELGKLYFILGSLWSHTSNKQRNEYTNVYHSYHLTSRIVGSWGLIDVKYTEDVWYAAEPAGDNDPAVALTWGAYSVYTHFQLIINVLDPALASPSIYAHG
jgi:hypothetical protein